MKHFSDNFEKRSNFASKYGMENKEIQAGTTLQSGKYTIERVIGAGGFGITYYARHNGLGHYFAIKEFFISGYCMRNSLRKTVMLQGIDAAIYDKYLQKFIEEVQILARLDQVKTWHKYTVLVNKYRIFVPKCLRYNGYIERKVSRELRLSEIELHYR